jgi:hypothetical protein
MKIETKKEILRDIREINSVLQCRGIFIDTKGQKRQNGETVRGTISSSGVAGFIA